MRLSTPADATYGTTEGPFYPPSMERLAAAIAALRPQTTADLDRYWGLQSGVFMHSIWGIDYLGDGYVPWKGFYLYVTGGASVWLILPHLRETAGGAMTFERMPALYIQEGSLTPEQLEEIVVWLVASFTTPLAA